MAWWRSLRRRRDHKSSQAKTRGEPIANTLEANEQEEEAQTKGEDWGETSTPDNESEDNNKLDEKHRRDLARDRLSRHTQGTEQVEKVITRTKDASKLLLRLSVGGAITIFAIGIFSLPQTRELLNLIPCVSLSEKIGTSLSWHLYLLLFIPTTLMAVLSITLWVTGLKFAAQLYGGASDQQDGENGEMTTECLKLAQEALKQSQSPGS